MLVQLGHRALLLKVAGLVLVGRLARRPEEGAHAMVVDLHQQAAAGGQGIGPLPRELDRHAEHVRDRVDQLPVVQEHVQLVDLLPQRHSGQAEERRDEVARPIGYLVRLAEVHVMNHALDHAVKRLDRRHVQPPAHRGVQALVLGEGERVHDGLRRPRERLLLALVHDLPGLQGVAACVGDRPEQLSVLLVDADLVRLHPRLLVARQRALARAVAGAVHEHISAVLRRRHRDDVRPLHREALHACPVGEEAAGEEAGGDDVALDALGEEGEGAVVAVGALREEVPVALAQEDAVLVVLRHADERQRGGRDAELRQHLLCEGRAELADLRVRGAVAVPREDDDPAQARQRIVFAMLFCNPRDQRGRATERGEARDRRHVAQE
mmetsp:Transcript_26627/g.74751  ORF Transcript_26627/g.74751 Transcript_26627/m.74751 type:complete len:381 (+) Transcript_26627:693-1835(+)